MSGTAAILCGCRKVPWAFQLLCPRQVALKPRELRCSNPQEASPVFPHYPLKEKGWRLTMEWRLSYFFIWRREQNILNIFSLCHTRTPSNMDLHEPALHNSAKHIKLSAHHQTITNTSCLPFPCFLLFTLCQAAATTICSLTACTTLKRNPCTKKCNHKIMSLSSN